MQYNLFLTFYHLLTGGKNVCQIIANDKKTWEQEISQEIPGQIENLNSSSSTWTIEDGLLVLSQGESNTNIADRRLSYEVFC